MHSLLWSGIPDSDFLSNGKVNASFRKVRPEGPFLKWPALSSQGM